MVLYVHFKILLSYGNTNERECMTPFESVVSAHANCAYLCSLMNSLFFKNFFILRAENLKRVTMVLGKRARLSVVGRVSDDSFLYVF